MKRSKFKDGLIMEAIKEVDSGISVPEICRELSISSATFYKWFAKYVSMDTTMMARMKEFEAENARVKNMYIEEKLKANILSEVLTTKW